MKGKKWLKEAVGELPCVDTVFNSGGSSYIDSAVPVMIVYDLIDQLNEPESVETEVNKQKLIEKWESAIEAAEFYGKGKEDRLIEYMREFVSDLNQLDEPKITELDALNRLAQNVQFSADEIANHLEKLSAHNGQVTYGNQEILSRDWIDEHRKSYTMEDSVEISELQNLLVPKQEELETKIQELIESYKQEEGAYSNPENGWIGGFIEDLKNLVEKEQKYYVLGKNDTPILFRDYRKRITETSNLSDIYPEANSEDFEFTEKEIKDYDERYWAFALPVEVAE